MNVGSEDLTLGDVDQDIPLKDSNKNIFNKKIESFGKDYQCLIAARKAYTQDSRPHLFILAIQDKEDKEDKEKCKIYVITFEPPDWIYINNTETIEGTMKDTEIKDVLRRYKNKVMMNLRDHALSEEDAEDIGKTLFETLIPDKIKTRLQNELNNKSKKVEWWVWVYSDVVDFNPIWEWLYTSPKTPNNTKQSNVANQKIMDKNSSNWREKISKLIKSEPKPKNKPSAKSKREQPRGNNKKDGFFWGDRFFLSRVPIDYDFHDQVVVVIEEVGLPHDDCTYALVDRDDIEELSGKEPTVIKIKSSNVEKLKNLTGYDCIHVAADQKEKKAPEYIIALEEAMGKKNGVTNAKFSHVNNMNKPHFLFLNLCGCNPNIRSKWLKLTSAKVWIEPSFNVIVSNQSNFTRAFYKAFCGKDIYVSKAATKARNEIGKQNANNFWRLAYIANENPSIKFTWR